MIADLKFICIYMMINNFTGQLYIGKTNNFLRRINEHFRGYGSENQRIDRACLKYGREAFSFKPLEIFDEYDEDFLNEREMYWIKKYNTYHDSNHYNLTIGGDGFGAGENNPRYRNDLDDNVIIDLYVNKKMSKNKIAKIFNTSTSLICRRLEKNGVESRDFSKNQSFSLNQTGYYRVSKQNSSSCVQGYMWVYHFFNENIGKPQRIYATNIKELEKKVKKQGLIWVIIDKEKAIITREISEKEQLKKETRPHSKSIYNNLWDVKHINYNKNSMFNSNSKNNPRKCFRVKYKNKIVPVGGFIDFVTPQIIGDLINEFVEDD